MNNFSINYRTQGAQQGKIIIQGQYSALQLDQSHMTQRKLRGLGLIASYFMPYSDIGQFFTALSQDNVFSRLDRDNNGTLSLSELDYGASKTGGSVRTFTGEDITAVQNEVAPAPTAASGGLGALAGLLASFGLTSGGDDGTSTSSSSSSSSTSTPSPTPSTTTPPPPAVPVHDAQAQARSDQRIAGLSYDQVLGEIKSLMAHFDRYGQGSAVFNSNKILDSHTDGVLDNQDLETLQAAANTKRQSLVNELGSRVRAMGLVELRQRMADVQAYLNANGNNTTIDPTSQHIVLDTDFNRQINQDDLLVYSQELDAKRQAKLAEFANQVAGLSIDGLLALKTNIEAHIGQAVTNDATVALDRNADGMITAADLTTVVQKLDTDFAAHVAAKQAERNGMTIDQLKARGVAIQGLLNGQSEVDATDATRQFDYDGNNKINQSDAAAYTNKAAADTAAQRAQLTNELAGMGIDALIARGTEINQLLNNAGTDAVIVNDGNRRYDIVGSDNLLNRADANAYLDKAAHDADAFNDNLKAQMAQMSVDELRAAADVIETYIAANGNGNATTDANRHLDINHDGVVDSNDVAVYDNKANGDSGTAYQQRLDAMNAMTPGQLRSNAVHIRNHVNQHGEADATDATRAMDMNNDNRITLADANVYQTKFESDSEAAQNNQEYWQLLDDARAVDAHKGETVGDNNFAHDADFDNDIDDNDKQKLLGKAATKATAARNAHNTRLNAAIDADLYAEHEALKNHLAQNPGSPAVTAQTVQYDLNADGVLNNQDMDVTKAKLQQRIDDNLDGRAYYEYAGLTTDITAHVNEATTAATFQLDVNVDGIIDTQDLQIVNQQAQLKANTARNAHNTRLAAATDAEVYAESAAVNDYITANGTDVAVTADNKHLDLDANGIINEADAAVSNGVLGERIHADLDSRAYYEYAGLTTDITAHVNEATTAATFQLDVNVDGIIDTQDLQIVNQQAQLKANTARNAHDTRLASLTDGDLFGEYDAVYNYLNGATGVDTTADNAHLDLDADGDVDGDDGNKAYALLNQRLTNNLATAKYYELGSFVQGARDHVNTAVSVNTWQFDRDGNQTIDTADGVALSALESTKKSEARDAQTARQENATYIDLNTEAAGLQADVDAAGGADIVVDDEAKAAKDINADGVINQADVDLTRDREAQIRQDALDAHDAHIAAATAQELTDEAAAVAQHINDNGEGLATNDTLAMDVNADGHIDQADVDKLTDAANDGRP